jgi:phosphoribosylglycinamide formyltransferase 1
LSRKRVGVLISGRGSNLGALIEAAKAPDFPAEIAFVLSNIKEAGGLALAQAARITSAVIEHQAFGKDRAAFDAAMDALLRKNEIEILCLAGFMRMLSPGFCEAYRGRMINIHPSLLPSFKGLNTHRRALEAGVKLHGCTTHFVEPDLDAGPIILQASIDVRDHDTEETLAARVLVEEHRIFPQSLRLLAAGALRIDGARVFGACCAKVGTGFARTTCDKT